MTDNQLKPFHADGGDISHGRIKEIADNAYGDEEKRRLAQRLLVAEAGYQKAVEPVYQYRIRNGYNGQVTEWQTIRRDQVDFVLKAQPHNAEFQIVVPPAAPVAIVTEITSYNGGLPIGKVDFTRKINDGERLSKLYAVPPAPVVLKENQVRELVNELRDIAIKYHGTQQLREHIARTIRAVIPNGDNHE